MVLNVLVRSRRNKRAAKRLLRKLLKRQCRAPRVMINDKLPSYGAAKRKVMPGVEHRQHKDLNNRAENSHQPTRRERQMRRFQSARQVQRFLSAHDQIANLFHLRRDLNSAPRSPSAGQLGQPWANNLTVPMALRGQGKGHRLRRLTRVLGASRKVAAGATTGENQGRAGACWHGMPAAPAASEPGQLRGWSSLARSAAA